MLALYDFSSRNNKEITVRKGDIVEASIRNLNHKTVGFFFLIAKLLNIIIVIICSSSTCSCWIRPTSGGRWGTVEERKATFHTMSWSPMKRSRFRWATSTRCQQLCGLRWRPTDEENRTSQLSHTLSDVWSIMCHPHWLSKKMDGTSSFRKEAKAQVQTNMHSIVWPAGTAKVGCKKTKWLAVNIESTLLSLW